MTESWASKLWSAWEDGTLSIQVCGACGIAQHPPGPVCSNCHSTELTIREMSGSAALVAWSTVFRAPSAGFSEDLPYTLAVVKLEEGALVEVRVPEDAAVDSWTVGAPVALTLGDVAGRRMPVGVVGEPALTGAVEGGEA